MNEVNENFLSKSLQEVNTELAGLESEYQELGGPGRARNGKKHCGVNTKEWGCGSQNDDLKDFKKWLNVRDQVNYLQGKVKALTDLLKSFLKSMPEGCSGNEDTPDTTTPAEDNCVETPGECDEPVVSEPSPDEGPTETTAVDEQQEQFSFLDEQGFKNYVKSHLNKNVGDKIGEGALHNASVAYLLENLHGADAKAAYVEARGPMLSSSKKSDRRRVLNATEGAIRELIDRGALSADDAAKINGIAFRAAQIDGRKKDLATKRDGVSEGVMRASKDAFSHIASMLRGNSNIKNGLYRIDKGI